VALAGTSPDAHLVSVPVRLLLLGAAVVAAACAHRPGAPAGREGAPEVREVRLEGVTALGRDEIRDGLATRATGRWPWSAERHFDPLAASNDERRIETFYALNGHHGTEAEHRVEPAGAGRVRVVFTVREGPPTRVRAVRFPGAEDLPEDVRAFALADLPLAPGERVRAAEHDVACVLV
jgi:hypothetical protein